MPANDNHGSDPRAAAAAPGDDLAAILAVIPSVPPPPVVDPSFTSPVAPMILRRAPRVVEPPEPWHRTALDRGLGWVWAVGDALTASRLGRWRVPLAVTLALALVGLFCEVGVGVRWMRRLLRLWAALVG